ncbi:uncharacterized protein N7498_002365 [Penicillium cinerascens]|uniref:Uncharacterized protein n=1 Tax=Penicillium cinerascens TaxID=70096 RepID=A0A9W9TAT1_9EURO|nr:uncharacterized protein N7498_002365 [Penicillium cinerascens]KAJ5215958.1 hypothetical protein N7498_002365 [Penicillium cinerascens]
MLRRRFSRESKSLNDQRDFGKLALAFSLKSGSTKKLGTELTVLEDIGSSLMSERGYDSDARNISTPTRANHMGGSPVARGFRRMELSDLVERSQERDESERWATDQSQNNLDSHDSPFGMHYISTPKSSLRGISRPTREMDSQCPGLGEHSGQMGLARPFPSLTASSQESGLPLSRYSPILGGPEGADDMNLMTHWDQYLKRGQKNGMVTSGSVPDLSTGVLVSKKRQITTSGLSLADPRTLHLGDFGISHRLASQTMSSGSMSSPDLVRNNRNGPFMSSQENLQPRQRSPQGQMRRLRDPSSLYSHQSSHPSSTNAASRVHSPGSPTEKPMYTSQGIKEQAQGEGPAENNGFVYESRFREYCDTVNSPSSYQGQPCGPNDRGSPRRVSAGWMSGGRRLGYGYSPVPGAEDTQYQQEDDCVHANQGPYPVIADANTKNECGGQSQGCRRDPQETVETNFQEPNPIPPPMNPKRHENGPATVPRATTSHRSTMNFPVPPYSRAFMGSRTNRSSRDYETGAVWVDEINIPDLRAPEVPPTTQIKHCEVPPSSHYSTHPNHASASRWSRLGQSMNVQPRARKNGEGLDGHGTGSNCNSRSAIGQSAGNLEGPAKAPSEHHAREHLESNPLGTRHLGDGEDQAGQAHPTNSRSSRWLLRLSKRRASRRLSNIHHQESSQESSQASSAPFHECDSSSARRTSSTKSSGAEDPASAYQDCLHMPGSFDGSRWANRSSRVLWDMVTTEDDH